MCVREIQRHTDIQRERAKAKESECEHLYVNNMVVPSHPPRRRRQARVRDVHRRLLRHRVQRQRGADFGDHAAAAECAPGHGWDDVLGLARGPGRNVDSTDLPVCLVAFV